MLKSKSLLLCCILFFMVTFLLYAHIEKKGTIQGRIIDKETGQPLNSSVNIVIEGAEVGAGSNLKGQYSIVDIPPGEYDVYFSSLDHGYVVKKNVNIGRNTKELNIEMEARSPDNYSGINLAEGMFNISKDMR